MCIHQEELSDVNLVQQEVKNDAASANDRNENEEDVEDNSENYDGPIMSNEQKKLIKKKQIKKSQQQTAEKKLTKRQRYLLEKLQDSQYLLS